jgi:hypothetical protein
VGLLGDAFGLGDHLGLVVRLVLLGPVLAALRLCCIASSALKVDIKQHTVIVS